MAEQTKSTAPVKGKNKLVQLKEKIAQALDETRQEVADILGQAVQYCEGLEQGEIRQIMQDKALRPFLKALGLQVAGTSAPNEAAPIAKQKGKRTRRSKVSDEMIIEFLATEKSVGEVREKLGQLVPKRLAGLEKAGKLVMREDGLKKLWKAK